jgi:hypothetical protein
VVLVGETVNTAGEPDMVELVASRVPLEEHGDDVVEYHSTVNVEVPSDQEADN